MVYKVFDKETSAASAKKSASNGAKNEIKQNQQLADEFHKPITKKFKKKFILHLETIF